MADAKPDIVQAEPLPPFVAEKLESLFTVHKLFEAPDRDAMIQATAETTRGMAVDGAADAALIAAYPKLEIIAANSVGVDAIDLAAAAERDIIVTNTPDVLTGCVADMAIALWLAATRRLVECDRFVRDGAWPKTKPPLSWRAWGKRLGIIGLGKIGKAIAERAAAFGMTIAYHGRNRQDDVPYAYYDDPVALAADSDVLILACPGGQETRHLVNAKVLGALGADGILVNVARGSVVDQPALVTALRGKAIRAAGLDVFEDEPNAPKELFALDNVVLQPHRGSSTLETATAMGDLLIENLVRHFDGLDVLTRVE